MARDYKIETTRNAEAAELYIHDDNTIEFTDPETNVPSEYLLLRLNIIKELVRLCREFGLTYFEMNKV